MRTQKDPFLPLLCTQKASEDSAFLTLHNSSGTKRCIHTIERLVQNIRNIKIHTVIRDYVARYRTQQNAILECGAIFVPASSWNLVSRFAFRTGSSNRGLIFTYIIDTSSNGLKG